MTAPVVRDPEFLLPVGTVTFLLTDVEGQSKLWDSDPEGMERSMGRHDSILEREISRFGGVRPREQGEGDSAVVAFPRPSDAAGCTLAIQLAITHEDWNGDPEIRLRIAVHTGEAHIRDEVNYFGPAITRCARLRDIAHGGQTLLSRATFDLVADRLPDGAFGVDLGTHRLKDLARPEQVFQLAHLELAQEFPPLGSLDSLPNNLPSQLSTFIGRGTEIASVGKLLADNRLVTLVGSGGCGKTRLALQIAAEITQDYDDGVWWVDLAPLTDPSSVVAEVANALSVKDQPLQSPETTIVAAVKRKTLLLLLDNCEHLISACSKLADQLLRESPGVTILATSREPLGIPGEISWRVPSLTLPEEPELPSIDALESFEAVRLFLDRATRARPNFKITNENAVAVVEICQQLDGIPLAIELAAARVRALSAEQIVTGLMDRFHFLTGGGRTALPRQKTLQASIEWSYDLLTEPEKTILRRLAVFAGGFSLDAAEAVCSGGEITQPEVIDLLSRLVERSLLQMEEETGVPRYRPLETIRQYARRELEQAGEVESMQKNHRDFFLDFLRGEGIDRARSAPTAALIREYDNVRAGLKRAIQSRDTDAALQFTFQLWGYWFFRYRLREALGYVKEAVALPGGVPVARTRVLNAGAVLSSFMLDLEGLLYAEEAIKTARGIEDDSLLGQALAAGAWLKVWIGKGSEAGPMIEEAVSLLRQADDKLWLQPALMYQGVIEFTQRSLSLSRSPLEESLALARSSSPTGWLAGPAYWLSHVSLYQGRLSEAKSLAETALRDAEDYGNHSFRFHARSMLVLVAAYQGDPKRSLLLAEEAEDIARELGTPMELLIASWAKSVALASLGRLDEAREAFSGSPDFWKTVNRSWYAFSLSTAAATTAWAGDVTSAGTMLEEALDEARNAGNKWAESAVLSLAADQARMKGDPQEAEAIARDAVTLSGESGFGLWLPEMLETLAGVLGEAGRSAEGARLIGASAGIREELGLVRFSYREDVYQKDISLLRDALGAGWDEEFEAGRKLSIEQAIAHVAKGRGRRKRPSTGWESLTPVELEVARLIGKGKSNQQIAEHLFISKGTVKTHITHIFEKLGLSSRSQVAVEATRHTQ